MFLFNIKRIQVDKWLAISINISNLLSKISWSHWFTNMAGDKWKDWTGKANNFLKIAHWGVPIN